MAISSRARTSIRSSRSLGRAIVELHDRLDRPAPPGCRRWGPTLARQLIEHLRGVNIYTAIDTSPGARAALGAIDGIEVAEELAGSPQLILANELMDNLPFRRLRGTASGTKEVRVGLDGDRFVEYLDDPRARCSRWPTARKRVLPEGATAFIDEVGARLAHPGYAL